MAARAGVTDAVFHEAFLSIEECYWTAYQEGIGRLSHAIAEAVNREHSWLARVRSGLVALLGFFDDEPRWSPLLMLELPCDGALMLERRQQLHNVLTGLLDRAGEGAVSADPSMPLPALTSELLAGGVFSVIRTSMLEKDDGRLVDLAPSLMAFIAVQFGRPDLAGGLARTDELAGAEAPSRVARLPVRATHRTALVLGAIAQTPYSNNREIACTAGITDEGQASKLLARLERQGVIENVGVGAARGEPNAWLLTAEGRRAAELLGERAAEPAHSGQDRPVRGAL